MTTILPHPLLSAGIVAMWLLLNQFSLGHLLLGGAVALVAGKAMAALEPEAPRVRRLDLAVVLLVTVTWDIVLSNIAVARQILKGPGSGRRAGFVEIDLALESPLALATLAIIVTSAPGTAWLDYDAARKRLLLHVFDLTEADEWQARLNDRYGAMLREIFP